MRVDGKNIIDFSAYILEGSYESLLSYPPLKKVNSTSWAEFDGIEVDLEDVKLDKKEVEFPFHLKNYRELSKLSDYLTESAYRDWNFDDLDQTYRLRFIGFSDIKKNGNTLDGKILLSDDFPLRNYEYIEPNIDNIENYGFFLDGVNFSNYGIIPLKDSFEEVLKIEKTKQILEVQNSIGSGVVVENQALNLNEKKVKLRCFIKANISDFFRNYNAFLYNLVKPNERILTVNENNYKCFYENSRIIYFALKDNIVWCDFDLSLVFF